jgi:uncharacterized protein (DUF608 family)
VIKRREFLLGAGSATLAGAKAGSAGSLESEGSGSCDATPAKQRVYNSVYEGDRLNQIAFPLGGLGAGMICLEGGGALTKFSLRHRPDLNNEPKVFAAVSVKGAKPWARVLEGPVPTWKWRPQFRGDEWGELPPALWGLPRFRRASFSARFPFANIHLSDQELPLELELTGWSPFCPGDSASASLPVAGIEYRFKNSSDAPIEAVFSFNSPNFLAEPMDPFTGRNPVDRIRPVEGGFILQSARSEQTPWTEGYFAAWVDDPNFKVNHLWFRGGWLDSLQRAWEDVQAGRCYSRDALPDASSPGASLFVPFTIEPGGEKTIVLRFAWYMPSSNLYEPKNVLINGKRVSHPPPATMYQPWYAQRFSSIDAIVSYWQAEYKSLRVATGAFTRAFYDSTLPPEALEAVAANLTILKSPTVLRQADGRMWGWEGSNDSAGSCYGSSTHVWNYAQAVAHLFPDLERSLRETEFGPNQNAAGRQALRAALPIRPAHEDDGNLYFDAADGQLGGILKIHRDWRIAGDTAWLRRMWPRIRSSLDYCIETWDPRRRGWIEEPHSTTYDAQFWGADSMCTSLYCGALKAAIVMGKSLNEPVDAYAKLFEGSVKKLEEDLFNGEYFFQIVNWEHLRSSFPEDGPWARIFPESPESAALADKEGPKYQYGHGCLADGVLGTWQCLVCGIGDVLDVRKVESHLLAVHRNNFKRDLTDHANLMRSAFACGAESGLLICTWPRAGKPSFPLIYADEVWTGIEYQVASHLIALGKIDEGLEIVRSCRDRYDGRVRNPFDEIEAGHWYARAMSSYALLQAFSGARFDAVDKTLYLKPAIKGDFRCFLSTASGFGAVGVKNGQPFVEVVAGHIHFTTIKYIPA